MAMAGQHLHSEPAADGGGPGRLDPILEGRRFKSSTAQPVHGIGPARPVQLQVPLNAVPEPAVLGFGLAGGEIELAEGSGGFGGFEPVVVYNVFPGTEAERAGLVAGDVIVAVNSHSTVGASQRAVTTLIKARPPGGGGGGGPAPTIVTLVVTKAAQHAVSATNGRQVRRAVLQRLEMGGLGFAVGPGIRPPGTGVVIEFVADRRPAVLVGTIEAGDEIVAVDGQSLISLPPDEAMEVLKGAGGRFELLIRQRRGSSAVDELLPPAYIPPPAMSIDSNSYHGNDSSWSDSDINDRIDTSPYAVSRMTGRAGSFRGTRAIAVQRDIHGLGFSIIGGIDSPRYGLFVAHVAEDGPAYGRLLSGDLVLFADNQVLLGASHVAAVDVFSRAHPMSKLRLVVFRDDYTAGWRAPENLRGMFALVSFIRGSNELGIEISGGADSRVLDGIYVRRVRPGSAAATVGKLAPGDKLLVVAGRSIVGMSHAEAATALRGSGSVVSILLQRSAYAALYGGFPSFMLVYQIRKPGNKDLGFQASARLVGSGRNSWVQVLVSDVPAVPAVLSASTDPARKLQVGDEIVSVNGTLMCEQTQPNALAVLKRVLPDTLATLVIRRLGTHPGQNAAVELERPSLDQSFGFAIQSGMSGGLLQVIVSTMSETSPAAGKLRLGDTLVTIDGEPVARMAPSDVVGALSEALKVVLVVCRLSEPDSLTEKPILPTLITREYRQTSTTLIRPAHDAPYGFYLGAGASGGIYVVKVASDGMSAGRLAVGDKLLAVNGERVTDVALEHVLETVRSSLSLDLVLMRGMEVMDVLLAAGRNSQSPYGFRFEPSPRGAVPVVVAVAPGQPADAQVAPGDRIVAVNSTKTTGLGHAEVAQLILNDPSSVRLQIERDPAIKDTGFRPSVAASIPTEVAEAPPSSLPPLPVPPPPLPPPPAESPNYENDENDENDDPAALQMQTVLKARLKSRRAGTDVKIGGDWIEDDYTIGRSPSVSRLPARQNEVLVQVSRRPLGLRLEGTPGGKHGVVVHGIEPDGAMADAKTEVGAGWQLVAIDDLNVSTSTIKAVVSLLKSSALQVSLSFRRPTESSAAGDLLGNKQ